jgi:hypothetical protein
MNVLTIHRASTVALFLLAMGFAAWVTSYSVMTTAAAVVLGIIVADLIIVFAPSPRDNYVFRWAAKRDGYEVLFANEWVLVEIACNMQGWTFNEFTTRDGITIMWRCDNWWSRERGEAVTYKRTIVNSMHVRRVTLEDLEGA